MYVDESGWKDAEAPNVSESRVGVDEGDGVTVISFVSVKDSDVLACAVEERETVLLMVLVSVAETSSLFEKDTSTMERVTVSTTCRDSVGLGSCEGESEVVSETVYVGESESDLESNCRVGDIDLEWSLWVEVVDTLPDWDGDWELGIVFVLV